MGLDLHIFYFSISDLANSDTLYRIQDRYHKSTLEHLTHKSGNWQLVSNYYNALLELKKIKESLRSKNIYESNQDISLNTINEVVNQVGFEINNLLETSDSELMNSSLAKIDNNISKFPFFNPLLVPFNNVKELNTLGVTIILTTHNLNEAQEMCNRIAIINKGNLVALDTTQKLLDRIQTKKINFKVENIDKNKTLKMEGINFKISSNESISVTYEKNSLNFGEIINFLSKNNIKILDIVTEDGDLEDVFVKLTNR